MLIMKKQTKNLAWQGTSSKEKRNLLDNVLLTSANLKTNGRIKDFYLGLASTCVDIINTAEAVKKTSKWTKDWESLLKESKKIISDAIKNLEGQSLKDWIPADFDVMSAAIIINSPKNKEELLKAEEYAQKGIRKSIEVGNKPAELLIRIRNIQINMAQNDILKLRENVKILSGMVDKEITEPTALTRVYRSIAEGSKFLAIKIATEAKLDNQVLKAENI